MTDPRIEIAARAIQAAADDHEEFCSASLVQAAAQAVLAAVDAARPEGWDTQVQMAITRFVSRWHIESMCPPATAAIMASLQETAKGAFYRAMEAALTAARATAAPDDNALPMDLLPEGIGFSSLIALKEGYGVDLYLLSRKVASQLFNGSGTTPRAAMLAAIKAAGPT